MNPVDILSDLEDLCDLIVKAQTNFKKCPKARLTKGYLEVKIQCIDDYWNSFKLAHRNLLKAVNKDKRQEYDYFKNEVYGSCEEIYMSTKADMKDLLLHSNTPTKVINADSDTDQCISSQVKLPRINLPIFSGNYEEWPTFQDLFNSIVHQNNSVSSVQKLHYLKSSVSGEAEGLLKNIQITEKSYTQAWDILAARYNNKRLIVSSLLKRMFNQRKILNQTANHIKSLHDTTIECLQSLKNVGVAVDSWDPLVIFLTVQKLDPESHRQWEEHVSNEDRDKLPALSTLLKFLENRFRTLELITPTAFKEKPTVRERSYHVAAAERTFHCPRCTENHALYHCKDFGKLEPKQRCDFVKSKFICYNCLVPGHSVNSCRLSTSCRICHKRHHSLLHTKASESKQGQVNTDSEPKEDMKVKVNTVMTSLNKVPKQGIALLATAVVTVSTEDGHTTVLRALIDPGSQGCFITERAVQSLRARRYSVKGSIIGVGSVKSKINTVVQVAVKSRCEDFSLMVKAYVISKQLTTQIPTKTITAHNWSHITGLTLADSRYYTPGSIDLLLGVNEYAQILQNDIIKGPPGTPCAQKTTLGWILFGNVDDHSQTEDSMIVMHHQVEVDDLLKALWEMDTNTERKLTKEEERCEQIYKETLARNKEGRYIVSLPFKTENIQSTEGNTKGIAIRRLQQLEKRFEKDPQLKQSYNEVMKEYEQMGHMEEVPHEDIDKKSVYLPHHAVVRSEKETTKTRVVFDASCKGTNGVSLNDELMAGPVLQQDLRSIIMRWRMHKICFTSDIEKMYRMILVTKEDADFQRIVWREADTDEIKDFRLLTVTFGTASAPYLAIKTLMQLADDEGDKYANAARMIREDFYVDDLISGCDTVLEAIDTSKQLQAIFDKGKFKLQKWSSNNAEFLGSIDPCARSSKANMDLKMDGTVKALGLSWNLGEDEFNYTQALPSSSPMITKRTVLADLQRLFDPLGWIAPVIVVVKILIQKMWLEGIGWDEQLNDNLAKRWAMIRDDLNNVSDIRVTRWMNTSTSAKDSISLHGFCDASMCAMAAVVYCRTVQSGGAVKTSIVAARTKVAPVKTVSMPRLELCAAVLLAKLLTHSAKAMRIPSTQVFAWSDSSVVLAWLHGEPSRWKPFVANRVVEILDSLSNTQWNHVRSEQNPADVASRGSSVQELQRDKLWWFGPQLLQQRDVNFTRPTITETHLERRNTVQAHLNTTQVVNEECVFDFEKYDSLREMQCVIIYCRRFLNYKKGQNIGPITTTELEMALQLCIKGSQLQSFQEEIDSIKKQRCVKSNSCLKSLCPYLDEDNVLRVGGRLRHADLSNEGKHPIILCHKNKLTALIVADAHQRTQHGGLQLMLCYLRSRFWIIRAKAVVKSLIHRCLVCAKVTAKARTQLMADLPEVRVKPARPFLHSGVDFAGPFTTLVCKGRGARTTKTYIAIFICMCTKAIHLELVGDLTSEAFVGAFRRFVARRGRCAHLWSDQGRNFIGANKELSDAWREAQLDFDGQIVDLLTKDGTQWHFIPPYSPNFGGLWEAGVKSTKYHLKRILTTNLTYEEMNTLLCQIESCLNSRPLCPIDDADVDNVNPLTPAHFLIGEATMIIPTPDLQHVNMSHLSRWKYTQKLLGDFWKRWQQEYLSRLQQRPKWQKIHKEFDINDITLIKQDNLPPGKWLLGRIVAKHPGPDGITRVYSVKSGESITKRCVSKLCHLPINVD